MPDDVMRQPGCAHLVLQWVPYRKGQCMREHLQAEPTELIPS